MKRRTLDTPAVREALVAAINEYYWDGDWHWRATLDVTVVRDSDLAPGTVRVEVDGHPLEGTLLPPRPAGSAAKVRVRYRA